MVAQFSGCRSLLVLEHYEHILSGLACGYMAVPICNSPTRHWEEGQGPRYPYGSVRQSSPDCIQPGRRSEGFPKAPPDHTCTQHPPGRLLVVQFLPGHMLRIGALATLTCGRKRGGCTACVHTCPSPVPRTLYLVSLLFHLNLMLHNAVPNEPSVGFPKGWYLCNILWLTVLTVARSAMTDNNRHDSAPEYILYCWVRSTVWRSRMHPRAEGSLSPSPCTPASH
jgi:hypothetical protein